MAGRSGNRRSWARRARIAAIVAFGLFVVVGLVGFFVAPDVVKSIAEQQIAEQLGRKATIGAVRLNPYRLSATIEDFKLYEADGVAVAVEVESLFADISSSSLFKRALVFDELRVQRPTVRITRLDAQRFSFSDVVDKLAAQPKSDEPTLFSINNIQLDGGTIDIDDRVGGRKHRIESLRIALPFLSNLPYDTAIFVTPEFAAKIDGSTFALTGKAQPFATSREAAVSVDVADLDLTEYVGLSPTRLPFRLASGKLAARLALTFRAAGTDAEGKTVPQSLSIAGHVAVAALDIADPAGRSAVRARAIDVEIVRLDPLVGDVELQTVTIEAPQVDATRRADGSIDVVDLFTLPASPPAPRPAAAAPSKPAAPPIFTIAALKVADAKLRFVDQVPQTPATTVIDNLDVEAGAVALRGPTPTTYKLTARSGGATFEATGSAVVEKKATSGSLALKGFEPARVAPYLATTLAARIDDGSIDAAARYQLDLSGPAPVGVVDAIALRIERLRTTLPDEKSALLAADAIALDGGSFDLGKRSFVADALKLTVPVIAIRRDAKGRLNLGAVLVEARPATRADASTTEGVAVTVEPAAASPFTAVVKSFVIERGDVSFEDLSTALPVRVRAQPLNLTTQNVGTALNAVVPFDLDVGIGRGKLAAKGKVTASPLDVEATIDANQVPVGWLAAYAGDRLNIVIESADLNTRGQLRATGKPGAPIAVTYKGSAGIARMRALDRATSEEFVRWKSLDIPRVDFQMPAKNTPFSAVLGTVALNDFYARLIVNANGRINLQDVVATPGQQQSVTTPEATPAPAPGPKAPASTEPAPAVEVAGIRLSNGRIGITDNFIKPNYSANLTGLDGEVSTIASASSKPADLRLAGRIDGEGVLDIKGKLNPFAATRYTDIAAEAKDIELTRLTPYAVKYAGYAIDRGKLSMTVQYHIENGKLDATNRLFLDQLTFGDKVESPTATKLPVLLAVALLKNSRGEIDVNLPISGSLSDPEFSVGGVIVRVLLNLLARAVTSPFALISAAVGARGGGAADELGYVQFKPGVSDMTPQGKTKLETLAKALADRPALKLDIIGRFDPATDPEGIKRDHLLDRVKDQKARDVSKRGERVGRDDVTIEPAEYAGYLAKVYDDTKLPDKPRNAIGLAKSVPVEEMERLLLASIKLDDNDPRWLAEARADVVRHYIEDTGKVAPSRVFLVTPKLNANGIDDQGVPNRVDFALR